MLRTEHQHYIMILTCYHLCIGYLYFQFVRYLGSKQISKKRKYNANILKYLSYIKHSFGQHTRQSHVKANVRSIVCGRGHELQREVSRRTIKFRLYYRRVAEIRAVSEGGKGVGLKAITCMYHCADLERETYTRIHLLQYRY